MLTKLTTSPYEASEFIRNGGLTAFPTETVYGLGADVFNEDAVSSIFEAKQRPGDNPLIAHISDLDQIKLLASFIPDFAEKLIKAFFPGPLTLVMQKTERVPLIATAGLQTIGVRMPRLEIASEFLRHCATPVAAPSANLSGRPSPTTWRAVAEDLDGRIDCILQGDPTEIGLESTVVDCTGNVPLILRSGSVTLDQIRSVVAYAEIYRVRDEDVVKSPGMRHRHYSPRASVKLVDIVKENEVSGAEAYIGITKPEKALAQEKIVGTVEEYAATVFEFFRECDRKGIETILCQRVPASGLGAALMDRLERAARK